MAEVRRYSRRNRIYTEIQPDYTPAAAEAAKQFDQIRKGFDAGIKFLEPAVKQEQTMLGEQEAAEAFENDSFEMRKPFSIRDAAFNKTGERLVTNRAMIELDEGIREAMQRADGSMGRLEGELAKVNGLLEELPDIPGLRTRWMETFERGAVTARRRTTELAERRAIAAQRRAAAEAAAVAEQETARLALMSGNPEELAAAISSGTDALAQFGPRGEFTLNGTTYEADPSRAGVYSAGQLATLSQGMSQQAYELFLRADYERSDSPGEWAREFERTVLSGNAPLPPDRALDLLSTFESKARTDENARIREENRVATELTAAAEERLSPYVTAAENGVPVAMPEDERAELFELVSGNADLTRQVQLQLSAADTIVEMTGMGPTQRIEYIERIQTQAAEDGRIDAEEASQIQLLSSYMTAAKSAITRESVGVTAAEQLFSSGSMPSDEMLAEMSAAARGRPEVERGVATLQDAISLIQSTEGMTGAQRREVLEDIDEQVSRLASRGGEVGLGARLRLDALELAEAHLSELEKLAGSDVTRFASKMGIELEPFPTDADAGPAELVAVIAARTMQVQDAASNFGNDTPVPLSASEQAALGEYMVAAQPSQRVAIVEQLYNSLPRAKANAILDSMGETTPAVRTAARIVDSNKPAVATILSGVGVTLGGDTPTVRATAEANTLGDFLGQLSPAGRTRVMDDAVLYARGRAAREGLTEILLADIEKGIDIALGADQDGVGGIEDLGRFGKAILPTGVSGRDVRNAFMGMQEAEAFDLFNGNMMGADGEAMTTREVQRSIAGFYPDPSDPGRLIPVNDMGEYFRVRGPDGETLASFSIEELLGDG
jgi:hypothetical protein